MSTHDIFPITLTTCDAATVQFDARTDETIVQAALRAGWQLPTSCNAGGCGACKAQVSHGDYRLASYSDSALSPLAAQAGEVLLCRTYALGELCFNAPFTRTRITPTQTARQARVLNLQKLPGNVYQVQLQLIADAHQGNAAEFEAGQYVELSTPDGRITRAYSLANITNWDGVLEFLIRIQANGAFSHYLQQQAKIGDVMSVRGPLGDFVLHENGLNQRYFIGGGTGLAPLLSMLRRMADWQDIQNAHLFLGVKNAADWFAESLLAPLSEQLLSLQITRCAEQTDGIWPHFVGTPVDALREKLTQITHPNTIDLYICGPQAMIEASRAVALAAGIPENQIFAEIFVASLA